jgi:hypothetical protein
MINFTILQSSNDNTHSQQSALIICSNCLAITDMGYIPVNRIKYAKFNELTSEECFIRKLLTISMHFNCHSSKETALSCLFSIIYNNDYTLAYALLTSPSHPIMTILPKLIESSQSL